MKAKKTMEGKEVQKHRRRKGRKVKSNNDSSAQNQTLKQQKQLNNRNHHIPININTDVNGLTYPIKRHHLANRIKKEDPTISAYRRPISSTETSRRRFNKPMTPGIAILISEKVDFKLH
jgi:hypothetical protein